LRNPFLRRTGRLAAAFFAAGFFAAGFLAAGFLAAGLLAIVPSPPIFSLLIDCYSTQRTRYRLCDSCAIRVIVTAANFGKHIFRVNIGNAST
jgi:ABC-type Na+ efflux pump permease subunit